MKLNLILLIVSIGYINNVNAQEILHLSLDEAVEKAKAKNYDIRHSLAELSEAQGQYRKTNSVFFPRIELSENYVTTNDPLTAFGFKLKQQITTQEDFNPDRLNSPDRMENFNTRLEIEQPLINVDGFAQRKAVSLFYNASQKSYTRQLQYVTYLTRQSYFDLWLATQRTATVTKSLEAAKAGHQIARDNYEAGYILESDLIAAELRVLDLETKLDQAKAQIRQANEQLKYILGIDDPISIKPTDSLKTTGLPSTAFENQSIPQDRPDLQALAMKVAGEKAMYNASRFKYLPNINAMASYEFNDDALFGTSADNYLVGVSLKWRIFDGYKTIADNQISKAKLDKARVQEEQLIAKQNKALKNAQDQLSIAFKSLNTSELAIKRSKQLYQLKLDRYKEGLEKTGDIIEAESQLHQKQMNYLTALYQYNISLYTIEFLLGHEVQ